MPFPNEHEPDPPPHPLAAVSLAAMVVATLTAVVLYRPVARAIEQPQPVAQVAGQVTVHVPTGTALIDALPWGRLERIESPDGETIELPAQRETPLLIELPAGEWRIALSHPALEEERSCELTVDEDGRGHCLVEFERVTVDQYFREAGWWR